MSYYILVGVDKYKHTGEVELINHDSNRLHLNNIKSYETDYHEMQVVEVVDSRSTTIQHMLNELNGPPDPL